MKRYLRDNQLKEKLGNCSNMTIWRYRKGGLLPQPKKINGINFTAEDEAEAAIEAMFLQSKSNSAA